MDSERELAAGLQASRGRSDEWNTDENHIVVASRKTEVVSFRLPSDELDHLEDAAADAGESISEYVRTAVRLRVSGGEPFEPRFDLRAGLGTWMWFAQRPSSESSAEGVEQVPDFPALVSKDT
jgi:hypothetical protein